MAHGSHYSIINRHKIECVEISAANRRLARLLVNRGYLVTNESQYSYYPAPHDPHEYGLYPVHCCSDCEGQNTALST